MRNRLDRYLPKEGRGLGPCPTTPALQQGQAGCRVSVSRFRKSHDFSAVVDGAGLPVIAAHRRESAHMAVSPKKRNASKKCAEAANVFAVRIRFRYFGHPNSFPAVVDPAPVDPTVGAGFSERAQVDVESVDADHRAAP